MNIDLEKDRRETIRWIILLALQAGGEDGTAEPLIASAVRQVAKDATDREIRIQLDYLERRELLIISGRDRPIWFAKMTRLGTDVAEYTVSCEPGIKRPPKYW